MLTKEFRGETRNVKYEAKLVLLDYDYRTELAHFEINANEKERIVDELERSGSQHEELHKNYYSVGELDGEGKVKERVEVVVIRCYLSDFLKILIKEASLIMESRERPVYVIGEMDKSLPY